MSRDTQMGAALLEGFEDWAKQEAEGPRGWTDAFRRNARERFEELGVPHAKLEDWRFTPLGALRDRGLRPADAEVARVWKGEVGIPSLDAHRVVLVDGLFRADLSELKGLPEGVEVLSWDEALRDRHEMVRARTRQIAPTAFEALHDACTRDGVLVRVPKGMVLEKPLLVQFVATQASTLVHPHVAVQLGESAQLRWVEDHVGEAMATSNLVVEVTLGANASCDHVKLARAGAQHAQLAHMHVHQERDSRFTSHSITLGGALVRNAVQARLFGENSTCTLNGLVVAGGAQVVDNHTEIHHEVERTTSAEHYRNVLDGRAKGVFSGKVFVAEGAQHTDAQQSNANLLLSDDAQMNTQPQLEIYADDIKASHGATLGQIDPDGLFYLRSRGIDETTARAMLVHAFANAVVESIELPAVRQLVRRQVFQNLPHDHLGEDLSEVLA